MLRSHFHQSYLRDWMGKASPRWPILCWDGRQLTTGGCASLPTLNISKKPVTIGINNKQNSHEPCVHHTCRHISHRNTDCSHPVFLVQQMLSVLLPTTTASITVHIKQHFRCCLSTNIAVKYQNWVVRYWQGYLSVLLLLLQPFSRLFGLCAGQPG